MNITLTTEQLKRIELFNDYLYQENEKYNLTAIKNEQDIIIKHYCDSLLLMTLSQIQNSKQVLDLGTGAGFPGIPLAIAYPEKKFVLLDALQKRTEFLKAATERLNLYNVTIIHGRAEDYGRKAEHREQYDCVVSRAVAELRILLEYCLPFVITKGYFVAQKGPDAEQELINATQALQVLGGQIVECRSVHLTSAYQRELVVIQKSSTTPKKYPRRAGIPKKRPL